MQWIVRLRETYWIAGSDAGATELARNYKATGLLQTHTDVKTCSDKKDNSRGLSFSFMGLRLAPPPALNTYPKNQ